MALGVISVIIGFLFAANSFLISPTGAPQQTVQYLGFVCSAVFLSCGFILFKLNTIKDNLEEIKISVKKITKEETEMIKSMEETIERRPQPQNERKDEE
jgi:hypothetical protein